MRELRKSPLKTMGGYVEFSVYLACLGFVIQFYGVTATASAFQGYWPLFFVLLSSALFGVILRFRIPKPKDSAVHSIFGLYWGAYAAMPGSKKNENDYVMKVVAHRACGLDAPENSLSAVQMACKEGITAVEFDVCLTADKIPIVFHDNNLYRMAVLDKKVEDTNFEEIRKLDISVNHPFGKNFKNERIPTLEEYVTYCLNNEIRMFIDLKDGERNISQIINDLFKQYPKMYNLAVVSSFNPLVIYRIRAKDPEIVCSLAWRPYFYSHEDYCWSKGPINPRSNNLFVLLLLRILNQVHQWALWKFMYYILGLSSLLLHKDMVTGEIINYWGRKGIRVIAWSVNLPTEKQYYENILEITYLTDTIINS